MLELAKELETDFVSINPKESDFLETLYDQLDGIQILLVEENNPTVAYRPWQDLLMAFSHKKSTIILTKGLNGNKNQESLSKARYVDQQDRASLKLLLGQQQNRSEIQSIGTFSYKKVYDCLKGQSYLSILTISIEKFKKVSFEHGYEQYDKVVDVFEQALVDSWGGEGGFRRKDAVLRDPNNKNIYYILLSSPRARNKAINPIDLEGVADRVTDKLISKLLNLSFDKSHRPISDLLVTISTKFVIGYGSILNNPSFTETDLVNKVIELSQQTLALQLQRNMQRIKEFLQLLMLVPGIIEPHYQGIFALQDIDEKDIENSIQENNEVPFLKDRILGFESLLRVNRKKLEKYMTKSLSTRFDLNFYSPNIIFHFASETKLAIELDQAALRVGLSVFKKKLRGSLFLNILPRNFYLLDSLKLDFPKEMKISFEISETEAVNNYKLINTIRKNCLSENQNIAIDDFGRGYATLEPLLKMKPEYVKLDRSLVMDIHKDRVKKSFVQGLVEAASISKTKILAEGVECFEELIVLKNMKIDYIQGFFLHRPENVDSLCEKLK